MLLKWGDIACCQKYRKGVTYCVVIRLLSERKSSMLSEKEISELLCCQTRETFCLKGEKGEVCCVVRKRRRKGRCAVSSDRGDVRGGVLCRQKEET